MSKGNDEKVFGMFGPAEAVPAGWSLFNKQRANHKYCPDNKIIWPR
jgi:hypothetical protein